MFRSLTRLMIVCAAMLVLTANSSLAQSECPPARLLPGQQALVLADALRVRDNPSASGTQVGLIYGGVVVNVIEGYVCAEQFNWWLIDLADITGWVVEGDFEDYYLEPYTKDIENIAYTPRALAWSNDGSLLAVGGNLGIRVYDTGDFSATPRRLGRAVNDLAFDPQQEGVVLGALEEVYSIPYPVFLTSYDARTGALVEQYEADPPDVVTELPPATQVLFSDQSVRFAYIWNGYVEVQKRREFRDIHVVSVPEKQPIAAALSSSGLNIVVAYNTTSGGAVGTERIEAPSDIVPFEERQDLPPVTSLAISDDNKSVLVGDSTGGLWIFSVSSRRLIASTTLESSISTVAFHPNGAIVAAGTASRLHILNAEDLSLIVASSEEAGYSKTVDIAYNPDGSLLAAIMDDEVVIFNSETYEVVATLSPE